MRNLKVYICVHLQGEPNNQRAVRPNGRHVYLFGRTASRRLAEMATDQRSVSRPANRADRRFAAYGSGARSKCRYLHQYVKKTSSDGCVVHVNEHKQTRVIP